MMLQRGGNTGEGLTMDLFPEYMLLPRLRYLCYLRTRLPPLKQFYISNHKAQMFVFFLSNHKALWRWVGGVGYNPSTEETPVEWEPKVHLGHTVSELNKRSLFNHKDGRAKAES